MLVMIDSCNGTYRASITFQIEYSFVSHIISLQGRKQLYRKSNQRRLVIQASEVRK